MAMQRTHQGEEGLPCAQSLLLYTRRRGVNTGLQIRPSVLSFGKIRRSDAIFFQIRIRHKNVTS